MKKNFVATWQAAIGRLQPRAGAGFVLLFEDEARFGRISEGQRRCWAPQPERPHAARQVVRQYVYAAAAVSPLDGRLHALVLPWMNAETMGLFLRDTAQAFAPDRCILFLYQAGWHTADDLRLPRGMKLVFLPARSPELNPTENLWKHIRQNYFDQGPLESLQAIEDRLCTAFQALGQQPEVVRTLCGYRWIKTISLTEN